MNAFARAFDPVAVASAFGDALRDAGFRLRGDPVMDGQWHRAPVEGDRGRKTSGRYRGYLDGWPAGFIEHFKNAAATGPWKYQGDAPRLSEALRDARAREIAAAQAARARATAARLERIAEASAARWERAAPASADHPYLARKRIGPDGLRIDGELILAPMRDGEGRLRCLQTIAPDGGKLFPAGSQLHGLHQLMGEVVPDGVLLIAEGWATARTLREARIPGTAVAVVYQKSNFIPVARAYRERFPGLRIAFAGDNDHNHPHRDPPLPNVGKENAEEAARALGEGAASILPFFARGDAGSDWNDFAALHGVEAVRLAVEHGLPPLPPPPPPPPPPYYAAPTLEKAEAEALMERTVRKLLEELAEVVAVRKAWAKRAAEIEARTLTGSPERRRELARARRAMAKAYGAVWKRREARGRRVFIRGSAGIGKSRLLSRLLSEYRRKGRDLGRVVYLTNLRRNYEQMAADTDGGIAIRGRLTPDPDAADGVNMCLRSPAVVEGVMQAGLNVNQTLCIKDGEACPFYDGCGYQRLMRLLREQADDYPHRFGSHEHLAHPAAPMRSPDLLIADESFVRSLAMTATFGADRLAEEALKKYPGGTATELEFFLADMAKVREALTDQEGCLAGLRKRGYTEPEHFKPHLYFVDRAIEAVLEDAVTPRTPDADAQQRLAGYRANDMGKVRRMLASLRAEIGLPRDRAHGVEYRPDERIEVDGKEESQDRIFVAWRREIDIPEHTTVLALDGTGSDLLLRRVLGGDLEAIDARCERNGRAVQVIDTAMPKIRTLGGRTADKPLNEKSEKAAERQRKRLAALADALPRHHGGEAFVAANKPVAEALRPLLGPGVMLDHFGGMRGSNDYEHCLVALIIGREQPPPRAAEDLARALFHDDPAPLKLTREYVKAKRGIRMRDGSAVTVEVDVHPNPRVQAVLETIREDEIAQAIDRIRLIHNVEPKHIYIATNVPCDVTVDRAVTFDALVHEMTGQLDNGQTGKGRRLYGNRLVEAARRGGWVLPLTPAELVRLSRPGMPFDGMWGSERAARDDLPPAAVRVRTSQGILLRETAPLAWVEVRYRRPGQPGSDIPALIASDTRDPAVFLAKLEAVVGPVVRDRFEVVAEPEPPPEPPSPAPPSPEEEPEDGPEPETLGLPLEVLVSPPPELLRRIAARAGRREPPRALVLELLPLAATSAPGACGPPVSAALH